MRCPIDGPLPTCDAAASDPLPGLLWSTEGNVWVGWRTSDNGGWGVGREAGRVRRTAGGAANFSAKAVVTGGASKMQKEKFRAWLELRSYLVYELG